MFVAIAPTLTAQAAKRPLPSNWVLLASGLRHANAPHQVRKRLVFRTNNFDTSENAFKTQSWIALSVYVLVTIVKKGLNLPASPYQILQILGLTVSNECR